LKRFSGQRYRTKLTTKVTFPLELDIGEYTGKIQTFKFVMARVITIPFDKMSD